MNVCFPIVQNLGLESIVFDHFGSAPLFVLADMDTGAVRELSNGDLNHQASQCQPLKALGEMRPEAVVAGGIGAGALNQLRRAGIRVYQALGKTVAENMQMLRENALPEMKLEGSCSSHGHGHAHHGHGHGSGGHSCCGNH